jgi:RHS repeat-associated protein
MTMPGRKYSAASSGYRYGFNGKETSPEISSGAISFEARIYDSRIGRFSSTDPRQSEYAWQSTYSYYKNCPTIIIDFKGKGGPGDEVIVYSGPTAMQAALMCLHVYGDPKVQVKLEGGWKVSATTLIKLTNDETGFKSQLYERTMPNGNIQYNYVYAGTEDGVDWKNNAQQIVGSSGQYEQAVFNAKILSEKLDGQVSFSGHSLGGGLASVAGLATGKSVIAFNPAWMSRTTALEYDILFTQPFQTNYIVKGEILNDIQTKVIITEGLGNPLKSIFPEYLTLQQRGKQKFLKPKMSLLERIFNPASGAKLHKMGSVIKALEKSGYKHSMQTEDIDASEKIKIPNQTVQT